MANAKKCDRCGVLYETWFPNKKNDDKKNDMYRFRDNIIKIGAEGDWWNYDLCSECYKKLVKFMKMED